MKSICARILEHYASGGEVPGAGGGVQHHPQGFCHACGYDHGSDDGELRPPPPPMCPACGHAFGGEVEGEDLFGGGMTQLEPSNLDAVTIDPNEERRRMIFAMQRRY